MSQQQLPALGLDSLPRFELELPDLEHTRQLGRRLAASLPDEGVFIGLVGNLGAGKTTLVQALVDAMAPGTEARSPTYTLLNQYDTDPPLIHIDLYRLESADELETLAYWDYVEAERVVSCVEWVDRIPHAWPGSGILLVLERLGKRRVAKFWASGSVAERVVDALSDLYA